MTQEALLYVMAGAIGVSAVALVIQAFLLFAVYRASKAIQEQLTAMTPRAEAVLQSAESTLEQSRKQVNDVATKAQGILESLRTQLARSDEFLLEATTRARVQMERVELVLDDSIGRVHETVTALNNGVLKPLREINAVAAGIRTTFGYLLRGGRPDVSQATTDEEMFI